MTNEMKENIIKYFTGNLENETPSSSLEYETPNTIITDLETTLYNEFSDRYGINGMIESRSINGNTLNYNVMYGYYIKSDETRRSFILIVDEKGNTVQIIKNYSSGAEIGYINKMKVDEEGYFYMVEVNPANDKRRFVMLNNIVLRLRTTDEFKVHIRKTYQVPDTSKLSSEMVLDITKAIGQAKYLIAGLITNPYTMCATELVINVGMENEWNDYVGTQWTPPGGGMQTTYSTGSIYGIWTDDSLDFIFLTHPARYPQYIIKYYKDGDGMSYTNIDASIRDAEANTRWGINYNVINMNLAYFSESVYNSSLGPKEIHRIYTIDLVNDTMNILYEQEGYNGSQSSAYSLFQYSIIDGELVFSNTYCDNNGKCHIEIGRLRNDDYIPSGTYGNISTYEIAEIDYSTPVSVGITFVNKQFNLYNYNILLGDTNYNGVEVYNSNNYNGAPFENNKCLFPNSGKLYDDNDNIVFARNLYNKTLNGGTTVSTLEVPNMYVNDITIAKQDLLSYNNNVMIDNEQDITTNIYETLNINFINEISMINENNVSDPINNPVGATRLNNSISANADYTSALLGKIKMNYSDNTTFIKTISPASQLSTYVYQYKFSIYVPLNKSITSVDLISNDGYTIYATIDTSNLSNGKTYEISQDVEIQ